MIHFDIPSLEKNLKTLEAETTKPEFWEDSQNSNKVLSKIKNIKGKCQKYRELENTYSLSIMSKLSANYDKLKAVEGKNDEYANVSYFPIYSKLQ